MLRNNSMNLSPSFLNKKFGIIVCADDFGISTEVNDAIIKLLKNERISAVSCLVAGKSWEQGVGLLKCFRGAVDIGLHLFYEEAPFNKILALAYSKRLSKKTILEKFKFQIDYFIESMGISPDYIDGHQHIHQLPVFRSVLMDLIDTAGLNKIYIRNSAMSLNDIFKRKTSIFKNIFIALPGFSLKRSLYNKRIPTNNDFLGIYNFHTTDEPGEIFERFFRTVKRKNSILMSHPMCENKFLNGKNNTFYNKRVQELKYLESNAYKETLERYGLYLTRFTDVPING